MADTRLSPPDDIAAEVELDADRLRRLLAEQHPDLAGESIEAFAEGWDNALFRVGEEWLARLPRRAIAVPLVAQERRWLPELAPRLPLPIPVPERAGVPGAGYPWPWSLSRWIEGETAVGAPLDPAAAADAFGGFLGALHGLDPPPDAPTSTVRGVPPRARSEQLLPRLDALRSQVDAPRLERSWRDWIETPDWSGRRVWCHGDAHPFNLLAEEDRLVAVLDWGDMHAGEPAPDLAGAWMLLPVAEHAGFRAAYGEIDEPTWRRARAWALYFGVMFLTAGRDGAGDGAIRLGHTILERVFD